MIRTKSKNFILTWAEKVVMMLKELQEVDQTLQELKEHGNLEYPVVAYYLNMDEMHLGYIRWHWHEEVEIAYVEEGIVEFLVLEESIKLSAGQAIFFNQNVLHSIQPVRGHENTAYSVVFHPAYLFGYSQTYMPAKYLIPLSESETFKYCVIDLQAENKELLTFIKKTIDINCKKDFGYELLTKGYLCQIWFSLLIKSMLSSEPAKMEPAISQDEARVKKAVLYIEQHYTETLSLEDIAGSIHVSKSECCRCFKRSLKLTPFEYLMKYRIYQSAKKMYHRKDNTSVISDLAVSVGFNNTSYYNKLFKKYLHCTPSQYKNQIKEGQKMNVSSFGLPLKYSNQ